MNRTKFPSLTTVVGIFAVLGTIAWAQHDDRRAHAEPTELQQAAHSRAWVLEQFQRNACRTGEVAVWVADKEADCLREVRP